MTTLSPHPPLPEYYGEAGQRERFVRDLFDDTAPWYDWALALMSFGSAGRYRRQALERAGIKRGDAILDIATGTGAVARAGVAVAGGSDRVIGLDPSIGMLQAGRAKTGVRIVQATSERLPFANASFDAITIGFAMRHFADLNTVFKECRRVLKPGGRLLILEITAPQSPLALSILGFYMGLIVPALITVLSRQRKVGRLMRYYWVTTRDCVRPEVILEAIGQSGLTGAQRHVEVGVFSEYTGKA